MPSKAFTTFSNWVADVVGRPITFVVALSAIVIWGVTGPVFHYSETWQLIVNTGTTIITFLMIFVLQNTQNRDGKALQAKLDELILTSSAAENKFVGIEKMDDRELKELRKFIDKRVAEDDMSPA